MTYLEEFLKTHPEWHNEKDLVCEHLCTIDYFPVGNPTTGCYSSSDYLQCKECWNREVEPLPEPEKESEDMNDTIEGKFTYATIAEKPIVYVKETLTEDDVIGPPTESIDDIAARELEKLKTRILDSGERREFASGAVRDIQEGKGRCDLIPLDVASEYLKDAVLGYIANFQQSGDADELYEALHAFTETRNWDNPTMLLEVSKHFEEGAKKYSEDNWRRGIPVRCYIDSTVRHYLKFLRGDQDEPHDRAFCWNILCAIWTCRHKPEVNEYAKTN